MRCCKQYLLSSGKTDLTIIVKLWRLIFLFKGRLLSELSLIFMKYFLYSAGLSFTFSIRFLIPSHSPVYFVNTSLFLSVEAIIKYLFPFFQLVFFYTYNFHNLNTLQHHMIYQIHIHIY